MLKGENMKEGFIVGVMLGAIGGMLLYRYSKDVQKAADKGEKIVMEELKNCQQKTEKAVKKATQK